MTGELRDFAQIAGKSSDVFYRYDLQKNLYEYLSPSIKLLTGYPKKMLLNGRLSFHGLLHPDDKHKVIELLRGLSTKLIKIIDISVEYRLRNKAGEYIWISDHIHSVCSRRGRIVSIAGILKDISYVKSLELRLQQTVKLNTLMSRHLPAAYFKSRFSDGKLLDCNDALWRMLEFENKQECVNEGFLSQFYSPQTRKLMLQKLQTDGHFTSQIEIQLKNQRTTWLEGFAQYSPQQGYIEGIFYEIVVVKNLTEAERTVLKLVLEGKCNKEIARHLSRSVRTVEDHRAHIMHKLKVHNVVELIQKAQFLHQEI